MSMRKQAAAIFALALLSAAGLGGCASASSGDGEDKAWSSGSWAKDVTEEYQKASSPEIKAALKDGEVSDQEYAEMKERYSSCLSSAGITLTRYDFYGGAYTPAPSMTNDEAHETESNCSDSSGEYPISYLYVQMRVNPSHKDLVQPTIDCYKREGLVGPSYGVKDYQAGDLPRGDKDQAKVSKCDTDPEGRLGG
jgi:hypothetical protein